MHSPKSAKKALGSACPLAPSVGLKFGIQKDLQFEGWQENQEEPERPCGINMSLNSKTAPGDFRMGWRNFIGTKSALTNVHWMREPARPAGAWLLPDRATHEGLVVTGRPFSLRGPAAGCTVLPATGLCCRSLHGLWGPGSLASLPAVGSPKPSRSLNGGKAVAGE
uniref:Uncharacterized protein n=1 Tax=Rangifer tarandus platyrhynchus TaxID=3082113 RepID=A0ACB0EAJ5_RANTA|nr:unnamed protein product [Rangifer tarandus platyrhynchus]